MYRTIQFMKKIICQTKPFKTALLAPLMCEKIHWPSPNGLVNSPWVCSSEGSRHRWECSRPQCRDPWGTCRCCPRSPPPRWRSGWSPSPPPPRPERSCSDYPATHQCMISRNVMTRVVDPDPRWFGCPGSVLRMRMRIRIQEHGNWLELTNKTVFLPFKNALNFNRNLLFRPITYFKYIFRVKFDFLWIWNLTRIRIRIRTDPYWFESLDQDLDQHWDKQLDQYPHWFQADPKHWLWPTIHKTRGSGLDPFLGLFTKKTYQNCRKLTDRSPIFWIFKACLSISKEFYNRSVLA